VLLRAIGSVIHITKVGRSVIMTIMIRMIMFLSSIFYLCEFYDSVPFGPTQWKICLDKEWRDFIWSWSSHLAVIVYCSVWWRGFGLAGSVLFGVVQGLVHVWAGPDSSDGNSKIAIASLALYKAFTAIDLSKIKVGRIFHSRNKCVN
jgi:hypothetical protein